MLLRLKLCIRGIVGVLLVCTAIYFVHEQWLNLIPAKNLRTLLALMAIMGGFFILKREIGKKNIVLARTLFHQGKYTAALPLLEKAKLKDNEIEASKLLGDMYFGGLGVTKDWNKAAAYYSEVMDMDFTCKMFDSAGSLGGMDFCASSTTAPFMPECVANLEAVAAFGNTRACRVLARWHEDGKELDAHDPDNKLGLARAEQYYRQAIALGDTEARRLLGEFFLQHDVFSGDKVREGISLLEKCVRDGDVIAEFSLGRCLAKGTRITTPDWNKAVSLFSGLLDCVVSSSRRSPEIEPLACNLALLYLELGRENELTNAQITALNQICANSKIYQDVVIPQKALQNGNA